MNTRNILDTVGLTIAERGLDYYKKGYVNNLEKTKSAWLAEVGEKRIYHVKLILNKAGNLQRASCTCPCDYYCKHIAATWFAVLGEEFVAKSEQEEILAASQSDALQDLRRVFNRYAKGADYWQARTFARELDSFLGMLDKMHETEQFQILKTFYGRLTTALMRSDDSDGYLGDLLDEAAYQFNQLYLQTQNRKLKSDIEKVWLKWINDKENFWLAEHTRIFEFWRKALYQSGRAKEVLDWIAEYEKEAEEYETSGIINWRYETLNHIDKEQAEAFLQDNLDEPYLRNIAIENLREQGKDAEAEKLLLEGLDSKQGWNYREEWQEELLKIAENTGQKDKAIKYAENLILTSHEHLQEHQFNALKNACSDEEWVIHAQKIEDFLLKNQFENKLAEFFVLDKAFDKLETLLLATEKIYLLESYASKLAKNAQEKVAFHWLVLLENKMQEYRDRPKYAYWVRQANKLLKKYPYLLEEMKNVAERFKINYKQRPALMEELLKLKI